MRTLVVCSLFLASAAMVPASIVATPEAAGAQATTVSGVITQDFHSYGAGPFPGGLTNVGTYSTGGQIVNPPDAFGTSTYIAVGSQSGTTSYSLTFNGLQSYFGFYWAAVDEENSVEFLKAGVHVQTFTSADINALLTAAYLGKPVTHEDPNEHFAYIDFTTTAGTQFDKVVFHNSGLGTGFETDNHSILAGVPEPGTYVLLGLGLAGLALLRRTKRTISAS